MDYRVGYEEVMIEDERIKDENTLIHQSQGQSHVAILVLHSNPSDLYVIFDSLFTSISFSQCLCTSAGQYNKKKLLKKLHHFYL